MIHLIIYFEFNERTTNLLTYNCAGFFNYRNQRLINQGNESLVNLL